MRPYEKPMRCIGADDPIPTSFGPGRNPVSIYRFRIETTPEGRPLVDVNDFYASVSSYGGRVDTEALTVVIDLLGANRLSKDFAGTVRLLIR